MKSLRSKILALALVLTNPCGGLAAEPAQTSSASPTELEQGFAHPPEQTKPWCYGYWLNDNISKEGITRDLEAMARAGIGEAFIGNIQLDQIASGPVKVLSEEWWQLVEHAIRESGRMGVNLGLFNCPGWSQSGGPWIKPEQTMRYLVSSETRVTGPLNFDQKLPAPTGEFQDVAVVAFPAPADDRDAIAAKSPHVNCSPPAGHAEALMDGRLDTALVFPTVAGQGQTAFSVELEVAEPFTARSLRLFPATNAFAADCELQAGDADGSFHTVRSFKCAVANMKALVESFGPAPRAFLVVPIVGSFLIDLLNALNITAFINLVK